MIRHPYFTVEIRLPDMLFVGIKIKANKNTTTVATNLKAKVQVSVFIILTKGVNEI